MLNNKITKKAFTLIELLVVITIIWILATGGIAVYTDQIKKSRDSVRIKDTEALRSALEMTYQDKWEYPKADSTFSLAVKSKLNGRMPKDKKSGQKCFSWAQCDYVYAVTADAGGITNGAYEVSTAFESEWNIDSKANNSQDSWDDNKRYELGSGYNNCSGNGACSAPHINTKLDTGNGGSKCTSKWCIIVK